MNQKTKYVLASGIVAVMVFNLACNIAWLSRNEKPARSEYPKSPVFDDVSARQISLYDEDGNLRIALRAKAESFSGDLTSFAADFLHKDRDDIATALQTTGIFLYDTDGRARLLFFSRGAQQEAGIAIPVVSYDDKVKDYGRIYLTSWSGTGRPDMGISGVGSYLTTLTPNGVFSFDLDDGELLY